MCAVCSGIRAKAWCDQQEDEIRQKRSNRFGARYYKTSLQRQTRATGMVSLCSACKDALLHTHIFGHQLTFMSRDMRSNFNTDLLRSLNTCFDTSWQEKHADISSISFKFFLQKVPLLKSIKIHSQKLHGCLILTCH